MEAKDTVISDVEIMALEIGLSRAEADHRICEKQAEISFKAGEKKAREEATAAMNIMVNKARKAGMNEVVEFVNQFYDKDGYSGKERLIIDWSRLQVFLKEKEL